MAEINVSIYFRHEEPDAQLKLVELFRLDEGDDGFRDRFTAIAGEINPENGAAIAGGFLHDIDNSLREHFGFEDVVDDCGFCRADTMFGGAGDRMTGRIVKFLYNLCPGIHALAWGMGDDDPWEFWFRNENDHLVRHDDEPFDGQDQWIRSTIYRWWHEGLPDGIREGMLNDEDAGEFDDEDDAPVSEEEYQRWVSESREGFDVVDEIEDIAMDELVGALTGALGSLFSGGREKPAASRDAFEADEITREVVDSIFADLDDCEKRYDIEGIMKHLSSRLEGEVVSTEGGGELKMPLTHSLYRMSLKLVLREDREYESDQDIHTVEITDGTAIIGSSTTTKFIDPTSNNRMVSDTEERWVIEIVEGRALITRIDSRELSTRPACITTG